MDAASPLLALRFAGHDHALERGRDYLLGTADDCDLRIPVAAALHHARIEVRAGRTELVDLGSTAGTRHNGERVERVALQIGDVIQFGDGAKAFVVADDGTAAIVPVPELRAAARARRESAVRIAAQALRRPDGETLQELIAKELQHAPWLALSLAVHAVVLLLVWLLFPAATAMTPVRPTVRVEIADRGADHEAAPAAPVVTIEPVEPVTEVHELPAPAEVETAAVDGAATSRAELRHNARISLRAAAPVAGGDGADRRGGGVGALGSGAFRETVGRLRKSGLEIVFVFDSTGSMTGTIHDTKTTIAQMLAVLRALVPDARVGLVTYRDRGPNESYLVRQVPLDLDFWRASNFVQFVTAEGGNDVPEDVHAGMRAAFQQRWRSGARRVVVLAGDAPPHAEDRARLVADVRAFAANGRSFVHTLVTAAGRGNDDTVAVFEQIAAAGRGTCEMLAAGDRVLQRVLTLAFGSQFEHDLREVVRAVDEDTSRVDTRALDLVRRGGPALAAALRENPVPQALWNALVRRPRRATAVQLVDVLGASSTDGPTRQAVAAALQRIFELSLPPVDPVAGVGPSAPELARLRELANRLPE